MSELNKHIENTRRVNECLMKTIDPTIPNYNKSIRDYEIAVEIMDLYFEANKAAIQEQAAERQNSRTPSEKKREDAKAQLTLIKLSKKSIAFAEDKIDDVNEQYRRGSITIDERDKRVQTLKGEIFEHEQFIVETIRKYGGEF